MMYVVGLQSCDSRDTPKTLFTSVKKLFLSEEVLHKSCTFSKGALGMDVI